MDRISALMDGELQRDQSLQAIERMRTRPEEDDTWQLYHLIGDALRREPCCGTDLCDRIAARLSQEPTVLAPHRGIRERIRSFAMPALAAAAAVATVTWVTVGFLPAGPVGEPVPMARNDTPAPALVPSVTIPGPVPPAVRPVSSRANLEEKLLAHRFLSPEAGASSLIPYVRPVTVIGTSPEHKQ